ncbi:MAG: oligosaccharide flippase family protein [Proteobacteria bacterium]|nr:oligosaccharide flippase family protein [Pseudomonadota bacterium]
MSSSGLKSRLLSGSFWAITGELIAGGARGVSYIVYARLLSPTDFGLVGYSLLFINLFPLLIDNSLGLALMRHPEQDNRLYSSVYYLNIALALVAMVALCLTARGAAALLHDHRIAIILPILSFQLLFNALCAVHMATARRRFEYRRLVPVRLISTIASLGLGIPLAMLGYAYWALVISSLGAALSQMIAAQLLLDWRPTLQFDLAAIKSLSGFASWVAVDMGVTWLVMSGGGFFLAFYLGAHDLGLFRLSDRIDTYLLGSVLSPLIPVLYAGFCETSTQPNASWHLFERSVFTLTPISLALAGCLVVAAHPLEAVIGAKWQGIATVVTLNAVADGVSYTTLSAPSLLRAHGLARVVAAMRIVTVIVQVAVYMALAPHGLLPFMIGKLAIEVAILISTFVVLRITFSQPIMRIMRRQLWQVIIVGICTIVGLRVTASVAAFGPPLALTAGLLAFALPVGAFLFLTQREFFAFALARLVSGRSGARSQ